MKTLTRSELIKRIDRCFQVARRWDGAFKKGGKWYNKCVTSGQTLPIELCDAGHYISRQCYATRWLPINCHCQSKRDNGFRNGAYIEYTHFIIKTYGMETYEYLLDLYTKHKAGKIPAFKMNELRELHDKWLAEARATEKRIGRNLIPKSWQPFGPEFIETPLEGA